MTIDLDDDEELTFDGDVQASAEPEPRPQAEPAMAASPEPKAETEAPQPQTQPQPQPEAEPDPADTAAESKPKRSKTGMMVAAGFAVCILASVTSAVMAWRAASLVAEANEGVSAKTTAAKLAYLQRLLEQQRDTLDGLSVRPGSSTAAPAPGGEGQLNALAAAVRANQEMNERLPAMIMQQVDGRLAGARVASAPRPAGAAKAAPAKLAKTSPKPKPIVKTVAASKPAAPLPLQPVAPPVEAKRPAGEAIRYP